jgi:hypothetical protein
MQSNLAKGFDVRWAEFSPDIAGYTARKPRTVAGRGFSNVRVRVDNDLTDSTFAAHLDGVIHDALEANLTVILAKKGEDLKADPTSAEALEAYAAWWGDAAERQVAAIASSIPRAWSSSDIAISYRRRPCEQRWPTPRRGQEWVLTSAWLLTPTATCARV